ncbi:OOP family OmpA-OmpF porin [Methylohalomonas lacus]|uniref:OOP family OmpA-OmpF porin n=2 Tax=Methylohalomonas lacus TaxID=398773 RepID=A0AAE3HKZ3_9GAMM|nr:OOP family OmpA-OmpF porin [Methylohalomonas lacus]
MAISAPVIADDVGYLTSSSGNVVKSGFGLCWNAGDGASQEVLEECNPDMAKADEPEPAAPKEPLDSDGDGVPDDKDWCAGTPAGVKVDERGCPLDSDGDGVADHKDKCPNTAKGTRVDEHGCAVVGTTLFTLEGVNFAFDSAKLRPEAEQQLQKGVRKLRDNRSANVDVIGHTDSTGPASYNQGLSQRRAQAVADYLTNNGVDASRLTVKGRGENDPIASNDTREGRAQNRRVELVVGE